jgi:hypothetical protein
VSTRTDSGAAEVLLPLATGLLIVGIDSVVPVGGAGLLGLMVLLTLGAVMPAKPWRTGAIAAAPIVLAAVVAAAANSLGAPALLVLASPALVAICAAAVKGGSMLAAPATEQKAGAGRWPFETQAQRGRFLVVVADLLVIGASSWRNAGAGEADRAAARRVEQIRGALQGHTAASLLGASIGPSMSGVGVVPGGPYRSMTPGPDRFRATAEVRKLAQARCIRVEVDAAGAVTTKTTKGACD